METVAVVFNLQEALLLKSVLEGHGIAAFIPDENTAQLNWLYVNAIGGIRVQVAPEVAARARALLDDVDKTPRPTDPRTGTKTVIGGLFSG